MKTTVEQRRQLRFAEFVLDFRTGELWRDGVRTLLSRQSFQILNALLDEPGELVTREELVKILWHSDVFVDFEGSLNKAMKRLRESLCDSAETPRFIETLPRRGYRFIAPVSPVEDQAISSAGLVGQKVTHYRVLEIIGGGGMGLVYKAEDLKLGRRVALKFLPEELASDPLALQRFEREARTASSLNHPNICYIHEFGEHEGQPFLAMELLEGETLRDRLAAAAENAQELSLDELLRIGLQVCEGLEAAHEQGIIHRDIKPANIFLTKKGVVKILDFGLAKLAEAPEVGHSEQVLRLASAAAPLSLPGGVQSGDDGLNAAGNDTNECLDSGPGGPLFSPATPVEYTLTRTGVAMGTAGYMSPEQVRGEKLDARTDLFSLGLVLYEMATGQRAFTGQTAAILKDAILHAAPQPVRQLNPAAPPSLELFVNRAIEKEREGRYQSATEMCVALDSCNLASKSRPKRRAVWVGPVAWSLAVVAIVVGAWLYRKSTTAAKLHPGDTIVLADFSNSTTDPIFNDVLGPALRVELEQTPFLNPLSPDKVRGILKQMGRSENERLTPELTRDVCRKTNSGASVLASISDAGNHYGIELRAIDCRTGKLLARQYNEAETRNAVINTLGIAGDQLRGKLGEPQASLARFHKPLEQALTSSLEALQSYIVGFNTFYNQSAEKAIPYLERAVQLDPNFAAAQVKLGIVYAENWQIARSDLHGTKAYELRDRVTVKQRLFIEYFYFGRVIEDANKTLQALHEWADTYPGRRPSADLAFYLRVLGRFPEAAAEGEEAIRADPTDGSAIGNLVRTYFAMNRLDDVGRILDVATKRGLDTTDTHQLRYVLSFLQNDAAGMKRELDWGERSVKPGEWSPFLFPYFDTLGYYGHVGRARTVLGQVTDSARMHQRNELAPNFLTDEAVTEAMLGIPDFPEKAATDALALSQDPLIREEAAVAFALSGDCSRSEPLAAELSRQFPLSTMMQNYNLPMIRAACAMHSDPAHATQMLNVAQPYEMGGIFDWNMQVVYVRGLAYLQAHEGKLAAIEFQKLIDHPGIVLMGVHGPLARLQLARAQVMMGEKDAARKSYRDFLTRWKDADPDIPIYKQAKAEFAKLQ